MKTLLRALAALLGPLAVLLLVAVPAGAHGGEGEAEITSITRDGDEVTVTAHLRYVEDGHGVPDATVTVVVDDGTAVTMEPGAEEGDYQATVTAPEGAAIRVTSVEPETTAEGTVPAADDPTSSTTEASTTTEAGTTTTDAAGDEDAAPATPSSAPDDEDDGISPIVIGAIAAVVLAAVIMAVILLRKSPSSDGPGTGA